MSSDFESYEQDFAVLTADITGRIGRVPKLLGGERWGREPPAARSLPAAGRAQRWWSRRRVAASRASCCGTGPWSRLG